MNKQWISFVMLGMAALGVQAQDAPVRIVGSLDLSGAAADVGRDALVGIQYAVEQLNKKGGVLGKKVSFEYQDGGSNPQRSISQANALMQGGAALLMSPQSSGSTIAVSKTVAAKHKVPMCVPVSTADDITMKDFHPYVISVTPNSFMEGKAMAARMAKMPYKRYALMSPDYAGGRSLINRFRDSLKEMNPQAEIVVEEYPKFGASDYTASINKILAAKPDYVFSVLFASDLLTFSKQANSVGFFKQINNRFLALYDFNTLKAMGDNAPIGTEGWQRAPTNYLLKQHASAKEFVDGFKAKTGGFPSDWTIMTYDCVMTWAQAANAAKSVAPDAVMKAIETGTFESSRGSYRFAAYDHQADVATYLGKVEQSKEFGQPVLAIQDVLPGAAARPSEEQVRSVRAASR